MKDVDILEPTSFLDHVYSGCTQRECKPNEKIIGQYNKMFESRISAGAIEQLPGWDKPRAKTSAWSYDVEGHARKCVERCCELANKKKEQPYKVSHPCLDDHQINKEEYAVVLQDQDLATQWIQSYPCKNKNSQETEKSLRQFQEPSQKPKVIFGQFIRIWQIQ